MYSRPAILLTICLLLTNWAFGQLQKTLHQSFVLPDSATTLRINLPAGDEVEIVKWAGNSIMTESQVQLYQSNKGLFEHFIEKGRYNYILQESGTDLTMVGEDNKRLAIKTVNQEFPSTEIIEVRVFIPDAFEEVEPGFWQREIEQRLDEDGNPIVRKKLDRDKITVSKELQEKVAPLTPPSDSLSQGVDRPVSVPDSVNLQTPPPPKDEEGSGN